MLPPPTPGRFPHRPTKNSDATQSSGSTSITAPNTKILKFPKPLKSTLTANNVPASPLSQAKQAAAAIAKRVNFQKSAAGPSSDAKQKRALEVVELSDDEEDELSWPPEIPKRFRTSVAAPEAMGSRVSQLIESYEGKTSGVIAGHQHPTIASKAKRVDSALSVSRTSSSTTSGLDMADFPRIPESLVTSLQARSEKSKKILQLPQERWFQCHRCEAFSPYDFDEHIMDKLRCANRGCRHACCEDCAVDSVGEVCEEQEWHDLGGEEWRQNMYGATALFGMEQDQEVKVFI